jgi:hypothetical protein
MTPPDLDLWLLYATEGLSWDSQKRVRAEIAAHVDDACQAGRAAGRSDEGAQAEALRGLGDPHEANRHFRKVYLCDADLVTIKNYRDLYPFPKGWMGRIVGFVIGYAIVIGHYS